jgi:acyl carrier protein
MTNQNDIEINDEELEEDSEFITAGQLAEYVDQEFVEDEIVSYHIYSKSDVESDLGVEITDEQWIKFLRLWENDEVLNEVRAETWMQAIGTLREELGIEEEDDEDDEG